MTQYYSYCLVRLDLPGPVQTVQAGHAWWQIALGLVDGLTQLPACNPNFVLIGVENEQELLRLARQVPKLGKLWYEDGPPHLGFTAFATRPLTGTEREFFQQFQILREKDAGTQDHQRSASLV